MKNLSVLMYTFKAIIILFLLWHWTSCGWYFINYRIEHEIYELTWLKSFKLDERSIITEYVLSMYFVIKIATGLG